MVGDSHLHVVSSLCAFPWWTCQPGGPSSDIHSWDMLSRDVAAWSARSEGCESSSTSSDPAERADKRYSRGIPGFRLSPKRLRICHRPRASIACLQCRSGSVCVLWSLGTRSQQSHNREPWPRALGGGGALKRAGRSCYNADYLGMGPRAGGGAGIINYQPGPAGRGGTTLT